MEEAIPQYKVFKGLQKPVEFHGLKGRYIKIFIIMVVCSILICFIGTPIFGTYTAIGLGLLGGITSMYLPAAMQNSQGLYNKKRNQGNYVICKITEKH